MMARLAVLIALFASSLSVVATPLATVIASDLIMARSHEKFPPFHLITQVIEYSHNNGKSGKFK